MSAWEWLEKHGEEETEHVIHTCVVLVLIWCLYKQTPVLHFVTVKHFDLFRSCFFSFEIFHQGVRVRYQASLLREVWSVHQQRGGAGQPAEDPRRSGGPEGRAKDTDGCPQRFVMMAPRAATGLRPACCVVCFLSAALWDVRRVIKTNVLIFLCRTSSMMLFLMSCCSL